MTKQPLSCSLRNTFRFSEALAMAHLAAGKVPRSRSPRQCISMISRCAAVMRGRRMEGRVLGQLVAGTIVSLLNFAIHGLFTVAIVAITRRIARATDDWKLL